MSTITKYYIFLSLILGLLFSSSIFSNIHVKAVSYNIYYVDQSIGDDQNTGTQQSSPLATISAATNLAQSGDKILVKAGTYDEEFGVYFTNSGTAQARIYLENFGEDRPKITSDAFCTICLDNRSFITISGFDITNVAEVGDAKDGDGNGILMKNETHNIEVSNNVVHGSGGAGIGGVRTDSISIIGNRVYGNAKTTIYGSSGISLYQSYNKNSRSTTQYDNIILNNVVFENENLRPFTAAGGDTITDGNGIIIDDSKNTQEYSGTPDWNVAYTGRTLVANNLVVDNGGRGIHVFFSDNVDIINNTLERNSRTSVIEDGDLTVFESNNVNLINNLIDSRQDRVCGKILNSTSVNYDYNLCYSPLPSPFISENSLEIDPEFNSLKALVNALDYRLNPTSPAVDSGQDTTVQYLSSLGTDILGLARKQGDGVDIGAFETSSEVVCPSDTLFIDDQCQVPNLGNISTFDNKITIDQGQLLTSIALSNSNLPQNSVAILELTDNNSFSETYIGVINNNLFTLNTPLDLTSNYDGELDARLKLESLDTVFTSFSLDVQGVITDSANQLDEIPTGIVDEENGISSNPIGTIRSGGLDENSLNMYYLSSAVILGLLAIEIGFKLFKNKSK
ncbi:MAG: choice-of-anchor Q domain-containing protein [Patescibacteria group bacterium]